MYQFIGQWDQLGCRPAALSWQEHAHCGATAAYRPRPAGPWWKDLACGQTEMQILVSGCWIMGDWITGKGRAGGVANESSTWAALVPYPFESNQSDLSVQ